MAGETDDLGLLTISMLYASQTFDFGLKIAVFSREKQGKKLAARV